MTFFFAAYLAAASAGAATIPISVTATVNGTLTTIGLQTDSQALSRDYNVLITGGVGTGYFRPDAFVSGIFDTNNTGFGSHQSANGTFSATSGGGTVSIHQPVSNSPANQSGACTNCWLPFTYGVMQLLHVELSADATYGCQDSGLPGQPACTPLSPSGFATFRGINGLRQFPIDAGPVLTGTVELTDAPEPASIALFGFGILALGFGKLAKRAGATHPNA